MANTYLTHTPSNGGTPGTQTFTLSFWIKRSKLSSTQRFLGAYTSANLNTNATFNSNDTFQFYNRNTNAGDKYFVTNRKFRDTNAWYHFVIAIDTTLSTEADRVKFYVNGVEETSFSEVYEPPQNYEYRWGEALAMNIGVRDATNSDFFDGSMSHFHYIDGTQYSASDFGETDSTTGEWKIKTSPSVTYGNDGYFILKDGNSVTDQSGNSNNFTVAGGTLTKTEDNPSNVFCTNNPLWKQQSSRYLTHTRGNTMISAGGSNTWYQTPGTLAFNSGKFYWECKFNAGTNLAQNTAGVIDVDKTMEDGQFQDKTGSVFYKNEDGGETRLDGVVTTADYGLLTQNQILGVAVDMDATTPTVKFYRNGSLLATVNASSLAGKFVTPAQTTYGSGEYQINYGNGYFAETAVSSAGINASGNGIFEYDVPTGYTALSTKGLNL